MNPEKLKTIVLQKKFALTVAKEAVNGEIRDLARQAKIREMSDALDRLTVIEIRLVFLEELMEGAKE